MTATDLEFKIKLNMLKAKYSKYPMEAVALCIDSAITVVEFAREQYRAKRLSKLTKGCIDVNANLRTEVLITPEGREIPINKKDLIIDEGKGFIPYTESEFYKNKL